MAGRQRAWWGTSNPKFWLPLDITRPRKTTWIVLDVAARVKPTFSLDDPDKVLQLLRTHVPQPTTPRNSA
jgi:hypothetical protein